jgi:hypothetical protein
MVYGADPKHAKDRDQRVGPVVPITLVVAKLDAQNQIVSSKKLVSRAMTARQKPQRPHAHGETDSP